MANLRLPSTLILYLKYCDYILHSFVGRKIRSIGAKFKTGFTKERTKRYMDLLATGMNCHRGNKYANVTNSCDSHHHRNGSTLRGVRRKRFVGKLLCEKLAEKACKITADLCKGKLFSTHLVPPLTLRLNYS